jgi:hypothetical protein
MTAAQITTIQTMVMILRRHRSASGGVSIGIAYL